MTIGSSVLCGYASKVSGEVGAKCLHIKVFSSHVMGVEFSKFDVFMMSDIGWPLEPAKMRDPILPSQGFVTVLKILNLLKKIKGIENIKKLFGSHIIK